MDIERGFTIEVPAVLVPWGLSEDELFGLVPTDDLRRVTDGYCVLPCVSMGGLEHALGFHFRSGHEGRLWEFELFVEQPLSSSTYDEWQQRLERTFGKPDTTAPADFGFSRHEWRIGAVEVLHTVVERFTEEEHVRISKPTLV